MVIFHLEYDYTTLTLLNMSYFPMMAYVILSSTRIVERAVLWQLLLGHKVKGQGHSDMK